VRFRIPALRRNEPLKRALETGLGGNGVRSVSANTCTGTVLVLYDNSHRLDEIERRVQEVARRKPQERAASVFADGPAWHSLDADNALATLGSGRSGLSAAAAGALLRRNGPNALVKIARRSGFEILVDQFRSLPVALLAGTAVLSLTTGGLSDAVIVLAVIAVNGLVGFVSETWAEQTIASLEQGALPATRVLRDGIETAVPAEQLVPGDVVLLHRDELVPADARLVAADRLTVNEAALTGESLPVAKAANVLAAPRAPLAERRNMLFRGSVVTGGSGRAVVVATGERTEISRVQALLGSTERPETPLQRQLDELGRLLVIGAFAASGLMLLIGLLRGHRLLTLLRSAVSLGVAAVPEGLPTTVTTTLAFGVRALARENLLVRRLEAIEALGSIRLVCFDKTGTLTLNRMTVTRLRWNGQEARISEGEFRNREGETIAVRTDADLARLIEVCVLCNDADPAEAGAEHGSSTEIALLEAAETLGADIRELRDDHPRRATVERAEGRRYMATVHPLPDGGSLVAAKGDPSALLPLCTRRSEKGEPRDLDDEARAAIEADNLAMAEAGLRVLGIGFRHVPAGRDPGAPAQDLTWLGLVGMADPIRPGAAELVRAFRRAGIATVMLTGDQRATALAIAAEVGLINGHAEVIEGDQLDDAPIAAADQHIFARLNPAQKLQVIAALQRSGARVAMIGDGVNDTPALKAADVGITLAASATDVARGIADIVLVGEDLRPLTLAFERGRSVHVNIRRATRYLIATNLSEIALMLFATASGAAQPLSPAQLLWINLLTDVLPAMGLALEPPGEELMSRPQRDAAAPVMSTGDIGLLARDAGLLAGGALAAQLWAGMQRGPEIGATAGFNGLVAGQLLYALACSPRPWLPGAALGGTLVGSFAAQLAALFLPGLRHIAGQRLGVADLALSTAAGLAPVLATRALGAPRRS
jgi:P-type Ca2+ transporter type 2C